tara:strand:- start:2457 stop:2816 length:360 start_codon:yes stop_codon:yes gene_type:complete
MIGFPMLPGVPQMAKQAEGGILQAPTEPSTWDYFLKGWDDAGGMSSLPGMVGETINEMPFMNQANKLLPVPTGPDGKPMMPGMGQMAGLGAVAAPGPGPAGMMGLLPLLMMAMKQRNNK